MFNLAASKILSAVGDAISSATSAVTSAVAAAATAAPGEAVSDATSSATVAAQASTGLGALLLKVEYFIVVPMVYISLLFCLVMIVIRIASIIRAPKHPYSLKIFPAAKAPALAALRDAFSMPTIRRHKPMFWVFLMLFHISFALLVLGHFDLLPWVGLMPESSRHMLGYGLVGVGVTLPLFYFLFRRFKSPNREISTPGDYILIVLVIFLALFGDMMSWGNSWTASGFVMTKQNFAQYFDGLFKFTFADPRLVLKGSHYHFLVIHVFLANLFFLVLPFTKIMHSFFAIPINMLRRK